MRNFFDTLVESTTTKIKKSPMGEYLNSFVEDFKILKKRFDNGEGKPDLTLGRIDSEAIRNLKDIFLKNVPQTEEIISEAEEAASNVTVEPDTVVEVVKVVASEEEVQDETPRKVLKAELIQQAYDMGLDKKTNLKKMKKSDLQDLINKAN